MKKLFHLMMLVTVLAFITGCRRGEAPKEEGCVPAPDDLISWWPGDGAANDIIDGNNGALMNGVEFAPGKVGQGQAFSFSENAFVNIVPAVPGTFDFGIETSFTIDAWIFATKQEHNFAGVVSHSGIGVRGDFYVRYALQITYPPDQGGLEGTFGRADFFTSEGDRVPFNDNLSGTSPVDDGQWHYIACVYDDSTQTKRLYVDGVLEGTQKLKEDDNFQAPGDLEFGRHEVKELPNGDFIGFLDGNFRGFLDEVEIFNRALSGPTIDNDGDGDIDCDDEDPDNHSEVCQIFLADSAGKCRPDRR